MPIRYFVVVGRARPSPKNKHPKIYKFKVFAKNDVKAKSKFWKHLAGRDRVKRANGQILAVHQITDPYPLRVKNFGFWLKYRSRTGTHNMYREYRAMTLNVAAQKLYDDMAGRHKAQADNVHIIDCREISDHQVQRARVKQFLNPDLKFRNPFKRPRAPTRRDQRLFTSRKITSRLN